MKHLLTISLTILLFCTIFTGCVDDFLTPPTTYEYHPTKIQYTLSYGYRVITSGTGEYDITYDCDIPEVLQGGTSYHALYPTNFTTIEVFNNTLIRWNINGDEETTYTLGVEASVVAESYLITDLTGIQSLTLSEIHQQNPDLSYQYLQRQSNGTVNLTDPDHPDILTTAQTILEQVNTSNAFLVGQAVFTWLQEQTTYDLHDSFAGVQPAAETMQKRSGDCDDLTYLYVSLCRAAGLPARFIRGYLIAETIDGTITSTPHAWSEIYVGNNLGINGWIPVECACDCDDTTINIHQNFGVENAFHLRLYTDDGTNESLNVSLAGITYATYGTQRSIQLTPFSEVEDYEILESKKLVITAENQRSYED